jgi:hypothetical protein
MVAHGIPALGRLREDGLHSETLSQKKKRKKENHPQKANNGLGTKFKLQSTCLASVSPYI